jgi:hypothetical protein
MKDAACQACQVADCEMPSIIVVAILSVGVAAQARPISPTKVCAAQFFLLCVTFCLVVLLPSI